KVNSECRNPDALKQCLQAALAFEPETMEDLLQCLSEVTRMLCASVMGDREGRSDSLKKQICAYIDARYSDSVLTQEEIAGAMQVTVSYLNRYFKAQTGQSLASYIDALRMEEARRLLRETKMTVKDIVAQVGYGNTNHFIRKFRTTYQMTPIQFRNLLAPSEADGAESDK
nr:AraC family transcriptional regulator [Clostridia bacterium]